MGLDRCKYLREGILMIPWQSKQLFILCGLQHNTTAFSRVMQ